MFDAHTLEYNETNPKDVKKGVYWIITDKLGEIIHFKLKEGKNIPIIINMRAVAKDPNGKWQLTASRYGIQTVEEIARKVFGPKYTKKDLETIKKLRQEEINRLAEIRTKTLQGESIIASITDCRK